MTKSELLRKIASFKYWHYPFDLGNGVLIKATDAYNNTDKPKLRGFIWPAVLDLCGGSLKGLRVLDVGCNEGFWSLEAHRSGAAYVLGIDARAVHIEQAELVRDALGVSSEELEYRQMNIYDLAPERVGEYDLCLLLRVLQHVRHPLLALERVRRVCRAHIVLDVKMVRLDDPVLYFIEEDPDGLALGVDLVALRPSKAAVKLMLEASGFAHVKLVPPKQPLEGSYVGGKRGVFTARVAATKLKSKTKKQFAAAS